jgi:tetratricopeptide (TPR) repeat protein
LTAREPDNAVWGRDLAMAHIKASEIAYMRTDGGKRISHALTAEKLILDMKSRGDSSQALQRLDATIRLSISQFQPEAPSADQKRDSAIRDLERVVEASNGSIHETTLLAKALISRGRYLSQTGLAADARSDWENAVRLLETAAKTSKDPSVIVPWVIAHLLLGNRRSVEKEISWLAKIGYRDPDYIAIAGNDASRDTASKRQ